MNELKNIYIEMKNLKQMKSKKELIKYWNSKVDNKFRFPLIKKVAFCEVYYEMVGNDVICNIGWSGTMSVAKQQEIIGDLLMATMWLNKIKIDNVYDASQLIEMLEK